MVRLRTISVLVCALSAITPIAVVVFAQTGPGTSTGSVRNPAGAVGMKNAIWVVFGVTAFCSDLLN
jgi:hypothetical protein